MNFESTKKEGENEALENEQSHAKGYESLRKCVCIL